MRTTIRAMPLIAILATALVAPVAQAQEPASSGGGHPFVGAWLVDTNTHDSSEPHSRLVVHPDGTLLQVDQTTVAIGVWEPVGETGAALTITAQVDAGDGHVALMTVRGEVTLDAAGDAWTGSASVEQVGADGSSSGQMGPIPASATRLGVEPMVPTASPGF